MNGNDSKFYTGSNLRPALPHSTPQPYNPPPRMPEQILETRSFKLDRKEFQITVREECAQGFRSLFKSISSCFAFLTLSIERLKSLETLEKSYAIA